MIQRPPRVFLLLGALLLLGVPRALAGARPRRRNPLAFAGETLDGWRYDVAERNARRRVIVYLADVTAAGAERLTAVAQRLHAERHPHNLEVVAVAVPPGYRALAVDRLPRQLASAAALAALARKHLAAAGATFPCVLDPTGAIVERYAKSYGRYKLDALPAFYVFGERASQPEGRPVFATAATRSAEPQDYILRRVLKQLGIEPPADVEPLAGHHPPAPAVSFTDVAGKAHKLADYRGHLVVFVLMAEHCPRCKQELTFLHSMLAAYGRTRRKEPPWVEVIAVCTDASGDKLEALVARRRYRFPVAPDADWAVRSAFRYRGATPDTFVIDPQGRIRFRHRGYTDETAPLLHMEIRAILGLRTRPMLRPDTYAGDEACRICHEHQHADWTLTRHACAWESLVRIGRQDDPKCFPCHVVGHGQAGGFVSARRTPELRNVQCESCHGKNGCEAFAKGAAKPITAATCTPCHDARHSPRFDFDAYRQRTLHNRALELAKLPRDEREKRLRRLCAGGDAQLFDPDTPYVGTAACAPCHPTEHKALQDGFHARALDPLSKPAPDRWDVARHKRGIVGLRKPECIRCHVTGHARPGGFPKAAPADPLRHPLAGVGCEACHGPGKAHAADPKKPGAIVKLGGTCPECHVLPICRRCHDDANDPDFNYPAALPRAAHPVGKAVAPRP